ncbi:MAG: hypothetical protein KC592_13300 [Nitrospira sp.]|nr:hypothetical protein [Nitrospira sp.]
MGLQDASQLAGGTGCTMREQSGNQSLQEDLAEPNTSTLGFRSNVDQNLSLIGSKNSKHRVARACQELSYQFTAVPASPWLK